MGSFRSGDSPRSHPTSGSEASSWKEPPAQAGHPHKTSRMQAGKEAGRTRPMKAASSLIEGAAFLPPKVKVVGETQSRLQWPPDTGFGAPIPQPQEDCRDDSKLQCSQACLMHPSSTRKHLHVCSNRHSALHQHIYAVHRPQLRVAYMNVCMCVSVSVCIRMCMNVCKCICECAEVSP